MKEQACETCAKRKVRCDRGEPCSNCKRRKQDYCTYPESSPSERIKKLEALVRTLGGDPEDDSIHSSGGFLTSSSVISPSTQTGGGQVQQNDDQKTRPGYAGARSADPVIVEEDGESFYLESLVVSPFSNSESWLMIQDVHGKIG